MAWILNDIKSIIPSSAPELSPTPAIGDRAPQDSIKLPSGAVLLNFLRHLGPLVCASEIAISLTYSIGCPFCEKTTRDMIKIANEKQDIQFLAVAHATQAEIDSWKKDLHLEVPKNMSILSDPERKIYAAYGVGELDFMSIFGGDVFKKVGELKKQGISKSFIVLPFHC